MLSLKLLVRSACALQLGLVLIGCDAPQTAAPAATQNADPVIATYNGGEIRRSDIAENLAARLAKFGNAVDTQQRQAVVRSLVARRARIGVLHDQAQHAKLALLPDVATRIAARQDLALAEAWLNRELQAVARVPEERLESEFRRRLPSAAREEMRAFSHIFLRAADDQARASARQKAVEIQRRLDAGEAFAALARDYSDSVNARAGGAVNLTPRNALNEDLGGLIFGLAEGQVSELIENSTGLHFFRVDTVAPAVAADEAVLRASIEKELLGEARTAAEDSARQLAVDEAAVDLAAAAQAYGQGCSADPVLLTITGKPLTCSQFDVLRKRWPEYQMRALDTALAWFVSNRVLADRERGAQGVQSGDTLRELLARQERNELVAARRDQLLDAIDTSASDDEIAARYRVLGQSAPELREFVADILFFVQTGTDVAAMYAEGEKINAQLRAGASFDSLLAAAAKQANARVHRQQGQLMLADLTRDQPPLRDELLRLAPGEVSAALHISGNPIRAGGQVLIGDSGLLFIRKIEERVLPLAQAREFLAKSVADAKFSEGRRAIKAELDRAAGMQLLLADG